MLELTAPPEYFALTPAQKADICNGCGAKGSRIPIPDTMYFLDISEACHIHDFYYHLGKNKSRSDSVFFTNLIEIIEYAYKNSSKLTKYTGAAFLLKALRCRRAWVYYTVVSELGDDAFNAAVAENSSGATPGSSQPAV